MLFGFSAAVAVFYVFARYRFPMVPILVLFAGAALVALYDAVASKRFVAPARSVLAAALVGVVLASDASGGAGGRIATPRLRESRHRGERRRQLRGRGRISPSGDRPRSPARGSSPRARGGAHGDGEDRRSGGGATDGGDARPELCARERRSRRAPEPARRHWPAPNGSTWKRIASIRSEPRRSQAWAPSRSHGDAPARRPGWYREAIAAAPAEALFHYQLSIALTELARFPEAEAELLHDAQPRSGRSGRPRRPRRAAGAAR